MAETARNTVRGFPTQKPPLWGKKTVFTIFQTSPTNLQRLLYVLMMSGAITMRPVPGLWKEETRNTPYSILPAGRIAVIVNAVQKR